MNKDQAAGKAKNFSGKIQEEVGKLVGSEKQKNHGQRTQLEGKLQEGLGNMKSALNQMKSGK